MDCYANIHSNDLKIYDARQLGRQAEVSFHCAWYALRTCARGPEVNNTFSRSTVPFLGEIEQPLELSMLSLVLKYRFF